VSTLRSTLAHSVGAFVAVTSVVLGATVAASLSSNPGAGQSESHRRATMHVAAAPESVGPPSAGPPSAGPPSVGPPSPGGLSSQIPGPPSPGGLSSQIPDTSAAASQTALLTASGVLVAHGNRFHIYQLRLAEPVTITVRGRSFTTTTVYRIDIAAGPYEIRDLPNVVSLNGRPLAVGLESRDLSRLQAFTFDQSVLTRGATLQVSYGLATETSTTWSDTIEVNR
jgi:hypothetical protein